MCMLSARDRMLLAKGNNISGAGDYTIEQNDRRGHRKAPDPERSQGLLNLSKTKL